MKDNSKNKIVSHRKRSDRKNNRNDGLLAGNRREADFQKLFHELQVHQIELELQNEELLSAKRMSETYLNKYFEIFDFAPVSYFIINLQMNIIEVNFTAASLLHLEKSNIIGMSLKNLLFAEKYNEFDTFIQKLINSRTKDKCEMKLKTPAKIMSGYFEGISINLEDGKKGCLIAYVDLTERQKAESELFRLQNLESLGVLAGGIAHDFNNILTSILGYLNLVIEDIEDEKIKTNLLKIEKSTHRAAALANQLLTFAKGGNPVKTILNLKNISQETVNFALSGSNIKPVYCFKHNLNIEADSDQISQVIRNIAVNSKQAMLNGGIIEISTEDVIYDNKKYVKISIKDNGCGIPKEIIHRIYDPYFTTKETGSGLGLAVVYSIVLRHNGMINCESELDKGTIFNILLPATDKYVQADAKISKSTSKSLNVLIMDDEEEVRSVLTILLRKLGHSVTESREGKETINIFLESIQANNVFDLVILDLTVKGGLGGLETLKKLREISKDIKIIVSSGYSDSMVSNFNQTGFDAFLGKPYTKRQLDEVIINIFEKSI